MSLRIATVFSGIGAIEHALERMGIEHEIVFACDNSNIDWSEKLTKTKKMVQLLNDLDDAGAKVEGIERLASCWAKNCSSSEKLQQKKIQDGLSEKQSIRLENIAIVCEECVSKNQSTTTKADQELPNLHNVLRTAIASIDSLEVRREMVNKLYDTRGKKAFVEESYLANYDVPDGHFHKDITFVDGNQYRQQVDLFVGGSPCQSFSFVGHRGGFDDARGTLFYDFVRLVDEIQPRMFIWENVKGVYTHDKGKTWEVISKCFDNTGYTWSHQVLNSKDYGIPQHRQRVFVVGFRNGGEALSSLKQLN